MKLRATILGLLLALPLAAALPASAQDTMTLKQAVDLLVNGSQALQIASENAAGAELKVTEARSQYLPQVSLAGSYTRMSYVGSFDFPMGGTVYKVHFGIPNNYLAQANVGYQVFNWGRTARTVELGKAGVSLANDGVALTRQALAYQVVPLYYGTAFFREAIKVLDDNIKAFEGRLKTARERYDAGLASSFEVSLMEVQISGLREQRLDFETNIDKFRIAFNSLTGRDAEAPFNPASGLELSPEPAPADALVQEAIANRPEFEQQRHTVDLGRASIGLAKTADKPTVVAGFNYQFRNGFFPDMGQIRGNWNAMLSVNYPVFDGSRVKAQVAQAESSLRAAELRRTDLERSVTLEVRSALADIGSVEQKLKFETLKVKQAEDALRIAEERYRNGLLSANDLIDTQNALEGARLSSLQLVYQHTLSRYNLYRACGRKL